VQYQFVFRKEVERKETSVDKLTARGDCSPETVALLVLARRTRTLGRLIWGRSMLGGKTGGWAAEPELPGAESTAAEPLAADGSAATTSSSRTALSSTFASLARGEPAKGDAGRERFEGLA
jgi:hypothetical protein